MILMICTDEHTLHLLNMALIANRITKIVSTLLIALGLVMGLVVELVTTFVVDRVFILSEVRGDIQAVLPYSCVGCSRAA